MMAATWSGGKDSCLAVYRMINSGNSISKLICILNEENRSRAHGLYREAIEKQAECMGISIVFGNSAWGGYRREFERIVSESKPESIVFGDIFVEEHKVWLEGMCKELNLKPVFPLWGENTEELAKEFILSNFEAYIVAVRKDVDEYYLGKRFDRKIVERLKADNIDPCGENGEFHTFVTGGPLFNKRVSFEFGKIIRGEKYNQLEILV